MEFLKKFSSSTGAKLAGFNLHNSFKTRQKKDPPLACRALFKGPKKRIRVWPAQRFLKPLKKGFHLRPARPKAFCPNGSSQQHKATSNPRKILLISHISPSHKLLSTYPLNYQSKHIPSRSKSWPRSLISLLVAASTIFSPQELHILFLVGEKGFSVQTLEINWLYIIGKKDSLRTRVLEREFLKRAFWTPKRTERTC